MTPRYFLVSTGVLMMAMTSAMSEIADAENVYRTIIYRNPFSLRPVVVQNPTAPREHATAQLTGITAFANDKKAWFVIQPENRQGALKLLCLREREHRDGIEILGISIPDGEVSLKKDGETKTVSVKQVKF